MNHRIVYAEEGRYAGWPANHGAWQWGDEFLVGFLEGPYQAHGMHYIGQPWHKRFARSFDGGESWVLEPLGEQFYSDAALEVAAPSAMRFDGDWALRFCGFYDHGGELSDRGGFYASPDRGHTWAGPISTDGDWLTDSYPYSTSRTCYLPDGLAFLSVKKRGGFGNDRTVCVRWTGNTFTFQSWLGDDTARCVMPAAAVIGKDIFVALRRRNGRSNWIELYRSKDGGKTWPSIGAIGDTGHPNGNPPAVIALRSGRLLCTWANRSQSRIEGRVLNPTDLTLSAPFVIRSDAWCENDHADIGYPRLLMRSDGAPVCIYYWADKARPHQHIVATEISLQ